MQQLFEKIIKEKKLIKEEIVELLKIDVYSKQFYELLSLANNFSRKTFENKGAVFAQVGIDVRRCSGNCKFCALAKDTMPIELGQQKKIEEIIHTVELFIASGAQEIFLMTTADYPFEKYLDIASKVKVILPEATRMIGNLGDFDATQAKQLKDVGFQGIYHICRLREGIDTDITLETRIATLEAIKEVGLELYYCVEPIGPEHTYEEIADEIIRATRYSVTVMAAMRRVAVAGTPLAINGEISSLELAKIVAVALLVVRPTRAMGVHEPVEICLIAGANQIYAEVGTNPRDLCDDTENGRGFSVARAKEMLQKTCWEE